MENGHYVEDSLWYYAPNKAAPVFGAVLFAISGSYHLYQCIRYKCWKVTGIFPWASFLFVTGYALREVGAFHYNNVNIFIASLVFIYAAPPLYELANYLILSRILYYVPYHSPIHPGRVLTTFGGISAVIEALNGNGAAYLANSSLSKSKQDIGRALLKSALILQLVVLGLFVALAAWFQRRCARAGHLPRNLRTVLTTLYISSALIGVRTIFRTVEYFTTSGINFDDVDPASVSPLIRYEWYFWVFEFILMSVNTILLNVRHPMMLLPRNNKIYLAKDGVTEIEGPGYGDKRPFFVTLLDPFDLHGMMKGKNMGEKFWETHDEGKNTRDVEMVASGGSASATK